MRKETIIKTYYQFNELPEDVKQKAIEKLYDINVDHDWWDCLYEDAENIGLKISEFDLDRASYVKGNFIECAHDTAKAILREHDEHCETYHTAARYLETYKVEVKENEKENADEEYPEDFLNTEDIDNEFLKSLCEDYRILLSKEYDYLTSEIVIINTIEANEYEFDKDGNLT